MSVSLCKRICAGWLFFQYSMKDVTADKVLLITIRQNITQSGPQTYNNIDITEKSEQNLQ